MIYWLVFLVFITFSFIDYIKVNITYKKIFFVFEILLMILFAGFRKNTDADYNAYVTFFLEAPELGEVFHNSELFQNMYGEPVFNAIIVVLKSLGFHYQSLFIFTALLTFTIIGYTIWKLSPLPFSSLTYYVSTFFLAGGFTQIRFGVATALFLLAVYFLLKKRLFIYFLLILIASGFHISVLIGLFLPVFLKITNKFRLEQLMIIVFIAIGITFIDLNGYFMQISEVYLGDSRYLLYFMDDKYSQKTSFTGLYMLNFLFFIFYFFTKKAENSDLIRFIGGISVYAILISSIVGHISILYRMGNILQIVFCLMVPLIALNMKRDINVFLIHIFLIFLYILKYNAFFGSDSFILEYNI